MAGEELVEGLDPADPDEVVQRLAGVGEVLAQVVVHRHPAAGHLGLHHLGDQRYAAAAGGPGAGTGLDLGDGGGAALDRGADLALAHVVARADLGAVGQGVHAQAGLGLAVARRQDQEFRRGGGGDAVLGHLQEGAVFVGVAHQHRAEQALAVGAHHDLLVDLLQLVGVAEAAAAGRLALGVADAGHIHAHQLEFGAHVGAGEACVALAGQVAGGHAGHRVARGDQAEGLVPPGCAFADGVDVAVAGAAVVVHRDAAAGAHRQGVLAGELVPRADAGGEHDHVGLQVAAVGEHHAVAGAGPVGDLHGVAAGVHLHPEGFDLAAQHAAAVVVHLHRHQARGELHHVGLQAEVAQGLGAFEAEQAAAHHHAAPGAGAAFGHAFQVFDGAIDEAVGAVVAAHRRHEGHRAGGQHQLVVGQHLAVGGGDGLVAPVDGAGAGLEAERETGLLEEARRHQGQVFGALAGEEFGQMHPVVGGAGLFAQHADFGVGELQLVELLEELVAHHAMTDNDDFHGEILHVRPPGGHAGSGRLAHRGERRG